MKKTDLDNWYSRVNVVLRRHGLNTVSPPNTQLGGEIKAGDYNKIRTDIMNQKNDEYLGTLPLTTLLSSARSDEIKQDHYDKIENNVRVLEAAICRNKITYSNAKKSHGFNTNGKNSHLVCQHGVCSHLLKSNGTNSNGDRSNGTNSQGTKSNGTNSNGKNSTATKGYGNAHRGHSACGEGSTNWNGSNSHGTHGQGNKSHGTYGQGSKSNGDKSNGNNSHGYNSNGLNAHGLNSNTACQHVNYVNGYHANDSQIDVKNSNKPNIVKD